jgi:hypothetical protein
MMPTSFMDLSGELHNRIYELVLVMKRPIQSWQGHWQKRHNLEILRANKIIHREASSIFYGENQFDFTYDSSHGSERTILAPLGKAGGNAAFIRSILVDFPKLDWPDEPNDMVIRKGSRKFLNQLRNVCPNVSKIVIPVGSTTPWEDMLCMGDAPINYSQVICMINTYFGVFEDLTEFTVVALHYVSDGEDFYCNNAELRSDMVNRGWKIQIVGQAVAKHEDDHSKFCDCEDDLSPYDSPNSDDDDDMESYRQQLLCSGTDAD